MSLRKELEEYVPYNKQEEKDKEHFLRAFDLFDDVLTRNNEFCHFTSSAFVVNENRDKMLVVFHNLYEGWIFPGGHADGESDLLSVAIREVFEETGLKVKVLDDKIFALHALPVEGHIKRGKYVSSHTDLDVMYLFEADEYEDLIIKEDENSDVMWISFDEACMDIVVPHIKPVNKKLIRKLNDRNLYK